MINDIFPGKKNAEKNGFHKIPDEALSKYRQASDLLHQGKTEDALHCYRQAVDIAPNYFEALHETGNCLQNLGRRDEASAYYARALQEIGDRLCEIGRYEESLGRYWAAISWYEDAGICYHPASIPEHAVNGASRQKIREGDKTQSDSGKMK